MKRRERDRKTYYICSASILAYPHQISSHIPSPKPHSLGVKTLPNHAAQLCTAPHHRVQPRADGGVEEVDAERVHVRARVNAKGAGRAVSGLDTFVASDRGVGCARVRVGRTRNISYRSGMCSWRALFGIRVCWREVRYEAVTGSSAYEQSMYDLGPP